MKLLKRSIKEYKKMARQAELNKKKVNQGFSLYQFEAAMAARWDVNKNGNIEFRGWLHEPGGIYNACDNCFEVLRNFEGYAYIFCSDVYKQWMYKNKIEIFQDILEEIAQLEEDPRLY